MSRRVMQAIRVHQYGGSEQLKLEQIPCPEPQAGEVLIRVHAAGVLPAEWKLRQGFFQAVRPVSFPYIPGSAIAGVVEEIGPSVTTFGIGQAVFGRSTNGAYAEYTTTAVAPPALSLETFSLLTAKVVKRGGILVSLLEEPSAVLAQQYGIQAKKNAIAPTSDLLHTIAQLIGEGHVKPTIARTFSLREARQAHELSQSGHGRGRLVLHITG